MASAVMRAERWAWFLAGALAGGALFLLALWAVDAGRLPTFAAIVSVPIPVLMAFVPWALVIEGVLWYLRRLKAAR